MSASCFSDKMAQNLIIERLFFRILIITRFFPLLILITCLFLFWIAAARCINQRMNVSWFALICFRQQPKKNSTHYANSHTCSICVLTYVSSTQSSAQRPGSDVGDLVVDGQTLNAADKATICPRRPDQPVSTRGSTHIQRGAESDLCVLTLKE